MVKRLWPPDGNGSTRAGAGRGAPDIMAASVAPAPLPVRLHGAAQPAPGRQVGHHVLKVILIAGLQGCFQPVIQRVVGEPPLGVPLTELADHFVTVGIRGTDAGRRPPAVTRRIRTVRRRGAARVAFHGPEYQRGPAAGTSHTFHVPG